MPSTTTNARASPSSWNAMKGCAGTWICCKNRCTRLASRSGPSRTPAWFGPTLLRFHLFAYRNYAGRVVGGDRRTGHGQATPLVVARFNRCRGNCCCRGNTDGAGHLSKPPSRAISGLSEQLERYRYRRGTLHRPAWFLPRADAAMTVSTQWALGRPNWLTKAICRRQGARCFVLPENLPTI